MVRTSRKKSEIVVLQLMERFDAGEYLTRADIQEQYLKVKTIVDLYFAEKAINSWLQSLKNASEITGDTRIVTVCDREADIYEFFKLSEESIALGLIVSELLKCTGTGRKAL